MFTWNENKSENGSGMIAWKCKTQVLIHILPCWIHILSVDLNLPAG